MESLKTLHQYSEHTEKQYDYNLKIMSNMRTHTGKLIATTLFTIMVLGLMSWIGPETIYSSVENEFIKGLRSRLDAFNEEMPEDRVYVQFDKPFYQPGETIWFSAYVRNAIDMKPSAKSDIVHVELISPKGNVERHIKLVAKNGQAAGDFQLGQDIAGGLYKVKAYTNWQKNEAKETFFEKELQVQEFVLPALKMKLDFERKAFGAGDEVLAKINLNTNENKPLSNYRFRYVASLDGQKLLEQAAETDAGGTGYFRFNLPADLKTNDGLLNVLIDYQGSTESVSRSIPIVLNKINFTMFPEGGDLVTGLTSRVAFRALNEFNKPADVEGVVMTAKGSQVETFSSFHMGMGAFELKPQAGEKYYVKITKPEGIKETFELPEPLTRGYVLNTDPSKTGEMMLTVNTTENEELSLVAQVRGKIYYATAFNAVAGQNKIAIPTVKFPIGVSQVTLFDSKGIARAERLVFVNKHKQLSISVTTDKEKYLPREKVKMTVTVKDDRGLPMPANLSMSVTNDQLLAFADDRSGNILSKLLLEQDLNDKVEEPAFYFDQKEPKADRALDYLLMTSGWRRFTWEQLNNNQMPYARNSAEQAIISGVVYDAHTSQPIAKASVKVNGQAVLTNEKGQFALKNVEPVFPVTLQLTAEGYNQGAQYVYDYAQNQFTYLYKPSYYSNNYSYPSSVATKSGSNQKFKSRSKTANVEEMRMDMAAGNGIAIDAEIPMQAAPVEEMLGAFKGEDKAGKGENEKQQLDKKKKEAAKEVVGDERLGRVHNNNNNNKLGANVQGVAYYRARKFAAPVYDKQENVEVRTDFRSTVYWNGNIEVDRTGKKVIEFYNSDDITSFRASVEGFGSDGMVGRAEMTYFTQLPFSMSTKIPVEVTTGDIVSIPVTLKNNTTGPLGGLMNITAPEGLEPVGALPATQTIMPGKAKTIYLEYKVANKIKSGEFSVSFKACGLTDAFSQKMRIMPKGFPATASFSGQDIEKTYTVELSNVVPGSVTATLSAYPSVVNDLISGVEGILREPGGCFEQTSMSSYPNTMVLDYLKTSESKDEKTYSRATGLLERGYNRLITFETKEKGYEWFGAAPGHEGLTAYGLMQFADMKRVGGDVDQNMLDRTANWLMSRKDGNGGFKRNPRALHDFGRISDDITNAYITYALAEGGYSDIKKELDHSYEKAVNSKDPYMLAMMANAMYKTGDSKRGDKFMEMLMSQQSEDGSWTGKTHSIMHSTGKSLTIETTSLAIMAMLKQPAHNRSVLTKAVQYLVNSRSGYGTFGNTQGTVLALKALTEYAKASKRTPEDGTIEFYVDGKKVAEKSYVAGEKNNIEIAGLEQYLTPGKHDLKVKFKGTKNPLPYAVAISYNTSLPNSQKECAVNLTARLASKTVSVGETVRLSAVLKNVKTEAVASPIAIIGIPAGFTVQPWQLKEMQERGVFDYYEVIGNNVVVYYRALKGSEVKNINFDLKAEVPGEYDAPASSGYLYYTNEYKSWTALDRVTIKKGLQN